MGNALPLPPPGFDELKIDEQIEYVQALWDRIAAKEDLGRSRIGIERFSINDWRTSKPSGRREAVGRGQG